MTRPKSMPIIVVAGLFDAIRLFFEAFWFWGPALAGLYCTVKGSALVSSWTLGIAGVKTTAALCSAAAIAGGTAVSEITTPLGVVMADAMALIGFLVLGLWILLGNARLLKAVTEAPLWFSGAFALSGLPLIGSFPFFSVVLWKLYGAQIEAESAAHAKWKRENADALRQEQQQRVAQVMQLQQLQAAQVAAAEQVAANDAEAEQAQEEEDASQERLVVDRVPEAAAAAGNDEIPQTFKKAA
ncbi:MAG: hypothetical protein B7W98_00975 [Parcubacteria group bacterium 20-58-5]|nr:MAG: hypothetical protein B7W98_00975 [Parcubacteria group bacterium 20-58-5]OYV63665.1 MAG: hypothetical protein B7X03_00700 [Parcubacteria group bacterium 21-58-10]